MLQFEAKRLQNTKMSGGGYTKLTVKRMALGDCNERDNQFCFVFVRFGKGKELPVHDELYNIAKKYANDPIKVRFVYAEEQVLEDVSTVENVEKFINDVIAGSVSLKRTLTHIPKVIEAQEHDEL
uniref:Uncharacterized protein n=1 Tax=Babesia bovis TaxID=5865 RepID=A7AP59_BABBO|eukprot:XP_001611911.1 hypothetical protein [Babesia bovis T2Bo]